MHPLAQLDRRHVWHPFTQMRDWLRREPVVLVSGRGAMVRDARGREYLDANSSIWTNLHGHNHPKINAAIRRQLGKVAHTSALGLANEPAALLAAELVKVANPPGICDLRLTIDETNRRAGRKSPIANRKLEKVFFSDDGSTAVEVALKLAYEFARRTRGGKARPKFLSLAGAYHGDTVGAVSLGHIDLFHRACAGLLFKSEQVMSPYCYRCPFNRAKPERADAREYRRCNWECVGKVEQKFSAQKKRGNPFAAFVVEPLMQGAAGMIPQPAGWLRRVVEIARGHGGQIIADEVMTGFGRTGRNPESRIQNPESNLFASHHEGVQPDYLCLAKGLTGGYLPMAATLTTQKVFAAFLGEYGEFKTFFHGHSYTGNQLGASAALASLEILKSRASVKARARLEEVLHDELKSLWPLPQVGDIRQVGLVVGVELVKDWRTREPFDLRERAGIRVCEAMARHGVLTRPVGSVVVLMPPYCTTPAQARKMVGALREAIIETFRSPK
ncbi:MAG: aminotransferase class III-fold pyridoxal phosphate-dependent enzyme [Verrucomicrobia bacterium]|nr:aminotransferase class III-fold pyridoxal phosphate-dependent enzyme [Verrucomicrobiota bacterium]